MSQGPTTGQKCAVDGCRSWAKRDEIYCASHYRQWRENERLGLADPTPRLIGRNKRLCAARSCKHIAIAGGPYCAEHTKQYEENAESGKEIAEAFSRLLEHLEGEPADCLALVQREFDLLTTARRILVSHAEMASRAGWKGISAMTFVRLWLSSTATATDLAKARFVMENATGSDFDRLLSGVYRRIETGPAPEQRCLPGLTIEQADKEAVETGAIDWARRQLDADDVGLDAVEVIDD